MIAGGMTPVATTQKLLTDHWRAIFNGDGYDSNWPAQADKLGLFRFDSGVDAICQFTKEKNVALFTSNGVFTAEECAARQEVMLDLYINTVETECLTMQSMMLENVIPDAKKASLDTVELAAGVQTLKDGLAKVHAKKTTAAKAAECRVLRMDTMIDVRTVCDDIESLVPEAMWSMASYKEMLFLDTHAISSK
jgi:glutamine synthetase